MADPSSINETSLDVRVRYVECDAQGIAHHSVFPVWMEMARTELLRRRGVSYRDLEARGVFFLVARLGIRYRRPAFYDDALTITVRATRYLSSLIDHKYFITRDGETLCTAGTTVACVDSQGKMIKLPSDVFAESH